MRNALKIVPALGIGVALGYLIAVKHLREHFANVADEEIEDLREYYEKRLKEDVEAATGKAVQEYEEWLGKMEEKEPATLEEAVIALVQVEEQIVVDEQPYDEVVNVASQKVNYNAMYSAPSPGARPTAKHAAPEGPYQISVEAFLSNEVEHTQDTMTWYSGDNVLADAGDKIVAGDERDQVVPEGLLEKLVTVEGENNEIYFRNDRIGMDVEVIRVVGTYKEAVGLGDEHPAS
jgi:hypothetical protein